MTLRRRTTGRRTLRCPQCNSARVTPVAAMILGQVYHCLDCDYVGSLILETEEPAPRPDPR